MLRAASHPNSFGQSELGKYCTAQKARRVTAMFCPQAKSKQQSRRLLDSLQTFKRSNDARSLMTRKYQLQATAVTTTAVTKTGKSGGICFQLSDLIIPPPPFILFPSSPSPSPRLLPLITPSPTPSQSPASILQAQ